MLNRVSLDGFFAGPNGEIDWAIPDLEVDKAAHEGTDVDTGLFGRLTYQMFESHWPKIAADPSAPVAARRTAEELNNMNKVVFSSTLEKVGWENSVLLRGDPVEETKKLKKEKGSGIIIFGSGTIIQQLTSARLIDDYIFIVTPVILGAGKRLFDDVKRLNLRLSEVRSFKSGNVLIHYKI
jgi:dihydrofolate reductase